MFAKLISVRGEVSAGALASDDTNSDDVASEDVSAGVRTGVL